MDTRLGLVTLREIRAQEKMIDYWLIVLSLHLICLLATPAKMARWSQIRPTSLPGQSGEYGLIQKSKGEAFDLPPISCFLKLPSLCVCYFPAVEI